MVKIDKLTAATRKYKDITKRKGKGRESGRKK